MNYFFEDFIKFLFHILYFYYVLNIIGSLFTFQQHQLLLIYFYFIDVVFNINFLKYFYIFVHKMLIQGNDFFYQNKFSGCVYNLLTILYFTFNHKLHTFISEHKYIPYKFIEHETDIEDNENDEKDMNCSEQKDLTDVSVSHKDTELSGCCEEDECEDKENDDMYEDDCEHEENDEMYEDKGVNEETYSCADNDYNAETPENKENMFSVFSDCKNVNTDNKNDVNVLCDNNKVKCTKNSKTLSKSPKTLVSSMLYRLFNSKRREKNLFDLSYSTYQQVPVNSNVSTDETTNLSFEDSFNDLHVHSTSETTDTTNTTKSTETTETTDKDKGDMVNTEIKPVENDKGATL